MFIGSQRRKIPDYRHREEKYQTTDTEKKNTRLQTQRGKIPDYRHGVKIAEIATTLLDNYLFLKCTRPRASLNEEHHEEIITATLYWLISLCKVRIPWKDPQLISAGGKLHCQGIKACSKQNRTPCILPRLKLIHM